MIIPLPVALILGGALFWPVTLGIAAVLLLLGLVLPVRWARITCFILAGVLAADCLLAVWLPGD